MRKNWIVICYHHLQKELLNTFSNHEIEELAPEEGEKFDPKFHQAMFEGPHPNIEKGNIIQVMTHGFTIGDRLLRAAQVGVSAGVIKNNNGMNQTAEGGTAIIIIHYSLTHSLTHLSISTQLTHSLAQLTHSLTHSLNSTHSTRLTQRTHTAGAWRPRRCGCAGSAAPTSPRPCRRCSRR